MEFAVLGPLRVYGPDGPVHLSAKQRAVLATLLMHPRVVVSTERLIAAVWDDPPRSAVANLQTYLSQLRHALRGTSLRLRTESSGYVCELPPGQLDLLAFEEAVRRARKAREAGERQAAERAYGEAVALWQGSPAEDARLGGVMAARIAELEEQLVLARSEWIDVRLELGRDDLVAELRTVVDAHPLRERSWAQLMLALHRSGRRSEALDAFREARTLLAGELGIEPGPELAELHAALLAGDPALSVRPGAPAFLGPSCQLPADTSDFVGRRAELEVLLTAARARRDQGSPPIVVVSGLPGVGKTTLTVHAAHRLRADYPDGQVFLRLGRDAAGPRRPADLLSELLRSLGVDGTLIPEHLEERARLLRQRVADLAVLIVLDDAQDETQVRHLPPGTARCCVLVTSRSRLPVLEGATRLPLDLPGEDDARQLLERIAGGARLGAAPDAELDILRACGMLPLAIRVAGARLAIRPAWPVREFAGRLADRRLDELVVGGLDVRGTFGGSYAALPEPARRAFRLIGLADLGSIAEWSAAALLGCSALEADVALETLVAAGMLDSREIDEAGQPRYRLHEALDDAHRAIRLLEELGDAGGLDYSWTWPIWIHMERGQYAEARRLCQDRLAVAGDDRRVRGDLLRALGTACYLSGEAAEAVRYYQESLLISEVSGHRVATGKVLRRLGEALGALGRFDEAVDALDGARSLFRESGDGWGRRWPRTRWGRCGCVRGGRRRRSRCWPARTSGSGPTGRPCGGPGCSGSSAGRTQGWGNVNGRRRCGGRRCDCSNTVLRPPR